MCHKPQFKYRPSDAFLRIQCVTCFALGGCGFGGCLAGCGRYCTAKAKGAKTLSASMTIPSETPNAVDELPDEEPHLGPDALFKQCCEESGVPASCMDKCSYKTYSSSALRNMFFRLDSCPMEAASAIHYCASQGKDHTRCCHERGVGMTAAGQKCLLFCEKPRENATLLDFSYMPCYDTFEEMKVCFWHKAVRTTETRLEDAFGLSALPKTAWN
uniref:DB domain-containing protein n=1 Tax=Steinernema glaseri TaxID=37863 RepID=A0A1I7YKC4_9BILA